MRLTTTLLLLLSVLTTLPNARLQLSDLCLPGQPATMMCVAAPFARYWQSNGGLPVFGFAITEARPERNADAPAEFTTQWTERNRLELHPENAAPYDILLGRMGADRLAQLGRDPAREAREAGPLAGCLWFAETGHNVCDPTSGRGFKSYWAANGLKIPGLDPYRRSLALFGLPLTAAQPERDSNGEIVLTQWFERARFEWRPGNPDPYKVQLGLLGNEVRAGQQAAAEPAQSIFGVTISNGYVGATADRAAAARVSWVRYGDLVWGDVESKPGARDWGHAARVEAELKLLSARGLTPILVVRGAPEWARTRPSYMCSSIKPEALDAFASFVRDAVTRYSAPPYNVKYWELWNEPDVDPALLGPGAAFGCWGDQKDPLYGGGYYAEMLKRVYPAIKQADPAANVAIGGLLMDCDFEHPYQDRTCRESLFFEGILRNGGAAAFDIVAYHGYSYWNGWNGKREDWDVFNPVWGPRGGVLLGKLQLLRSTMARYQVDKPVLLSETGLLCYQENPGCRQNFVDAQSNHLVRVYTRAWANGLLGATWYTLEGPGWEKGGLLDASQAPRPAYQALAFLTGLLAGATYDGPLSGGGVEGYAFRKGATRYEFRWTNEDTRVALPLPSGARAAYDRFGNPVLLTGSSVEISFDPIVVEVAGG
jgi:hypothetical protein